MRFFYIIVPLLKLSGKSVAAYLIPHANLAGHYTKLTYIAAPQKLPIDSVAIIRNIKPMSFIFLYYNLYKKFD